MQKNSWYITDKNAIFEYLTMSQDKSNVIGSLLSTKTFDFKSVDNSGETMLTQAILFNLEITPELLELSQLKQIDSERSLTIALKSYYSLNQIKLLLKYGANTTSNYYHNNSSVKIAIERCSNEMVKLILENTPKEYIKINNNNILVTAFRRNSGKEKV